GVAQVVVVDDGSRDKTAELAGMAGAKVVVSPENRGKGQALNEGLRLFRHDVLLLLDGDLGASAAFADRLLDPVLAGEVDMTIARFAPRPGAAKGWGLVKGLAAWGIRTLTGMKVQAPLSGQRALNKQVVAGLKGFAQGYGVEVALTIDVARQGYRIGEINTNLYHHGETGRDLAGILHRGRQFLDVAGVLAWELAEILISRTGRLSRA
ncbi:MAG TPA: glycosyltransferase, partial [Bacillota bacterium]|nr:glycosyltransferase [Bacillota bacterium]